MVVIKQKSKPTKKRKIIGRIIDAALIVIIVALCVWQDNDLTVTKQNYYNNQIPTEFNGYKIVQISDLHNKTFGKNNYRLIEKIKAEKPDIIVVTGDVVDKFRTNIKVANDFINQAKDIAPVYYVSGNHESWLDDYKSLVDEIKSAGAIIAEDEVNTIYRNDKSIDIIGLKDRQFNNGCTLQELMEKTNSDFNVVLSHQPQIFDTYKDNNADLVLCGHTHGGQIRVPFIGGLYSPNQGMFPKYSAGLYSEGNTTMYVSRGLGNSVFPIRMFNRPEIVSITLYNN